METKRISASDIRTRKGGTPIVTLTCYSAPMAKQLDPHVDILLVGDSIGMAFYGMESTLPVTLDMMIAHAQAVVRGSEKAMVVVDMPFGSYQASAQEALHAGTRVLKETGAAAVKLEGGADMAETIKFLTRRGIPVMGHVGLLPQHVQQDGGYRVHGRTPVEAKRIMEDAKAVADAGAFCLVVEGVEEPLARKITAAVSVPTIGIGASAACDGQVLVTEDMLGLFEKTPRFVKRYAELGHTIEKAVKTYAREVRAREFPGAEHCYPARSMKVISSS